MCFQLSNILPVFSNKRKTSKTEHIERDTWGNLLVHHKTKVWWCISFKKKKNNSTELKNCTAPCLGYTPIWCCILVQKEVTYTRAKTSVKKNCPCFWLAWKEIVSLWGGLASVSGVHRKSLEKAWKFVTNCVGTLLWTLNANDDERLGKARRVLAGVNIDVRVLRTNNGFFCGFPGLRASLFFFFCLFHFYLAKPVKRGCYLCSVCAKCGKTAQDARSF